MPRTAMSPSMPTTCTRILRRASRSGSRMVRPRSSTLTPSRCSFLASLPLAFIITGLLGYAIERVVVRRLYGRLLDTLLATWGVAILVQQAVRLEFGLSFFKIHIQGLGPGLQNVKVPEWMTGVMVVVAGGVGSLLGSVLSAGLLGQVNGGVAALTNDILARAVVFGLVILIIIVKPNGLFSYKGR